MAVIVLTGETKNHILPPYKTSSLSLCQAAWNSTPQQFTWNFLHGKINWFQIGKGVHQGCILSLCLFNLYAEYIIETLGWMKHKLESRLLGEISISSHIRWHHPYVRKWRGTKKPLDESERGEWTSWLNIQKTKIMASGLITSWQIDGEAMETVSELFFGLQNHCRWWLQPWNSRTLASISWLMEEKLWPT